MKKLVFLLIIMIGLLGCGELKTRNTEKKIKEAIQSDLTQQYGKYNLVISKLDLTGDGVYQGQMEVLYDGKPYQFPVSVDGDSYQYKFDSFIIKEEAEEAVKKLLNESMKEPDWKKYGMTSNKITLFPEGSDGYKGLATISYRGEEHEVTINVKHSYDSGIMYEIPSGSFSFLIEDEYNY